MKAPIYLSAREAAAELGVRRATLYAYVSRGLIRSTPGPGRERRYHADDVRRLRERGEPGAGSAEPPAGAGVLETRLTLITDEGPVYRGQPALALARSSSLEAVATLLWDCSDDPFAAPAPPESPAAPAGLRPVERGIAAFAAWPLADRAAYTMAPRLLAEKGAGLLRAAVAALLQQPPSAEPIHRQIAVAWGVRDVKQIDLLRAALVLSAEHEFNTSAFAVRCAASTRAPLHAALISGLGVFSGPRHGAASDRVDGWLARITSEEHIERVLQELLLNGEALSGFGHQIYRGADPRAVCLLELIAEAQLDHPLARILPKIVETAEALFGQAPNIDFALASMRRILGLPPSAGMVLFCSGRLVGWIAHALEQYQSPDKIRPRAVYVGERPR